MLAKIDIKNNREYTLLEHLNSNNCIKKRSEIGNIYYLIINEQ